MSRWKLLKEDQKVPVYGFATCLIKQNGKYIPKTVVCYPGWNYARNKVIAYMEVKDVVKDSSGWYSTYRGDEEPDKNGWYMVTLQSIDGKHIQTDELFFCPERGKWFAVPEGYEVAAYMPFPKPYKAKMKGAN